MSRIQGKDTKPEVILRKALWAKGLRYRKHYALPGRPDVVFVAERVAVFVDGCFWHSCPVHATKPKKNTEFWAEKLRKNRVRDELVNRELRAMGWHVCRVWEHEIRGDLPAAVTKVIRFVEAGRHAFNVVPRASHANAAVMLDP